MDGFALKFGLKHMDPNGTLVANANSSDISGWVTFTFLVGCVFGAAISSYSADVLSRRFSIFIGAVFFMVGGILQTASDTISVFYTGRVFSGIGVGLLSAVVPLFISETARPDVRGRLITVYQLMITLGIFIASCINAIIIVTTTGDKEWRLALGMQLIPAFILWLLIIILPFSPRWLLSKGRTEQSKKHWRN
eukprot:TRINITY_DN3858_c0_g1_i2.p1 TRINITY_DN3858_c0_g1~~TRINITY_DN3858_c0_g1_i2.p1  ORF type:complete len:193 (+),score=14.40 TRINITY_DN3858_c0_g1_i2:225-803(+)